jgi:FixJ family two-component response regulator
MPRFEVAEPLTPWRHKMNSACATLCNPAPTRVTGSTPIVFVVDDDISVRESLDSLIRFSGWDPQTFSCAEEFLSHPRVFAPSCLVLDVKLPDLNGLDLQRRLATERSDMPIIFLTGHVDVPLTVRAMKAGAMEFLTKPYGDKMLLSAIAHALKCSRAALEHDAEMRCIRDSYASLSRREQQVMALVVRGLINKQVGAELGISEVTVKAHRGRMMRKMQADSLPELVEIAASLPLSSPRKRWYFRQGWGDSVAAEARTSSLELEEPAPQRNGHGMRSVAGVELI